MHSMHATHTTTNKYTDTDATLPAETTTVQPGLTANGDPTTDINLTVDYSNINYDDDWAYIVTVENNE